MDYEKHEVKSYTKKYKSVKGKTKKTTSKSIYLGASTIFEAGDDVIVMNEKDFKNISSSDKFEAEIKLKNATISDLTGKIDELQSELNKTKNIIIMLQNKESYLEKIVLMYESFGLFDRLKKTNPKESINISSAYDFIEAGNIDDNGS